MAWCEKLRWYEMDPRLISQLVGERPTKATVSYTHLADLVGMKNVGFNF